MRRLGTLALGGVFAVLVLVAAAGGAALRLGWLGQRLWPTEPARSALAEWKLPRADLAVRPMHTDEAVQAAKFGELLDEGRYRYDPVEYHGPTLYYLTLPAAWWAGCEDYASTHESMYRAVPLVFGVGLVVLLLVVMDALGPGACVWAALLTAASHAMAFYSRYYIQEMLLVFFTFGAIAFGWRYARSRRLIWAILCGVFLGLMHATKETVIIAFFALAVALAVTLAWRRLSGRGRAARPPRRAVRWWHLAALILAGGIVSIVFYSSFLTHARGPVDSVLAYFNYADKAATNEVHRRPWYYYLQMLLYWKDEPMRSCPVWSEALIVGLAAVGLIAGLCGRGLGRASVWFVRFLAVYTVAMAAVYSTIGYKTPWCMLGFLHGMILLGGVGAMALLRIVPVQWIGSGIGAAADVFSALLARLGIAMLLAGACYGLGMQAWKGCFQYYVDPRNPYVYGHTLKDTVRLCGRVRELAKFHPAGKGMYVCTLAPNYWPLPWYLRDFTQMDWCKRPPTAEARRTNVLVFGPPNDKAPSVYIVPDPAKPQQRVPVSVLVIGQPNEDDPESAYLVPDPEHPGKLVPISDVLWQDYEMEFYGLRVRPSVFLRVYVHRDLWGKFIESRAKIRIPPPKRGSARH